MILIQIFTNNRPQKLFFSSESDQKLTYSKSHLIDTLGCQIPKFSPFDPTIIQYYTNVSAKTICGGKPSFIEVKPNAHLEINESILKKYYGLFSTNISCSYKPIVRDPKLPASRTDNSFKLGQSKTLTFGISISEEFIIVQCNHNQNKLHKEYIPLTPIKKKVERKCQRNSKMFPIPNNLNVMFIGIDSVSKLNFLRHFKKTNNYLHEVLNPIELFGYTKVGDNTFPNLVPLLTGHFVEYYWNETNRNMFFDKLHFIWKDYAARGYRTMFAEDAPTIATFNYLKNGFQHPPTDYYFRPFALALEKSDVRKNSRKHCVQEKLEIKVVYNYVEQFLSTMSDKKFFMFAFITRLTHDVLNNAGYGDEPTFQLLKHLHAKGVINNTLFFFFSDHGIRFGKIRIKYIGKLEERMPFIFLMLPRWFLLKYPQISKNIYKNQRRLTTPFDLHATLVHLLKLTNDVERGPHVPFSTDKGISLFDEIPVNRTCNTAFILPHWCTCNVYKEVETTNSIVVKAARALLDTINQWLEKYKNKCEPLSIALVVESRVSVANEEILKFQKHIKNVNNRDMKHDDKVSAPEDYLLTVMTYPNKAIFESTVRYYREKNDFKVLNDVSRLDKYENQSKCINIARLRKFCACKRRKNHIDSFIGY
ncbi:uncharacterized protein LOC106465633 [Limulus polyphemus]|uniref:Uncharacterized protein LOC106465633 n=1 Tax=Limulus polyphemus TaxID=6850 RepID=A0ABM1BG38_LIMPO|nr:uncharacterized protein LOC106465633 [Limulus polyphemus]